MTRSSARAVASSSPRVNGSVWGVVNVTPDSFSDGGRFVEVDHAVAQASNLLEAGADVIDIGGASSRPRGAEYGAGAGQVDAAEEGRRVVPVVREVASLGLGMVSIDTTRESVARAALTAGATIVNDVSCAAVPALLRCVAEFQATYVLMHNRGDGSTVGPSVQYSSLVDDVCRELLVAAKRASAAGIARDRIWLDPGLGFAKTPEQSMQLLAATDRIVALGYPVLVGVSRKSFIGAAAPLVSGEIPGPGSRQAGTAAAVALAAALGAAGTRVHDVTAGRQASLVGQAFRAARMESS